MKAPTIVWGGTNFGVSSVASAPVELVSTLVASGAEAKGRVLEPGTIVFAGGKGGLREGYLELNKGRLAQGVEQNVEIRLQAIRLLEVQARVIAAGVKGAATAGERAGLLKELDMVQSFLKESVDDLNRYLTFVPISAQNLTADVKAEGDKAKKAKLTARRVEQNRVVRDSGKYRRVAREATQAVETAVAQAGLEDLAAAAPSVPASLTGSAALGTSFPWPRPVRSMGSRARVRTAPSSRGASA